MTPTHSYVLLITEREEIMDILNIYHDQLLEIEFVLEYNEFSAGELPTELDNYFGDDDEVTPQQAVTLKTALMHIVSRLNEGYDIVEANEVFTAIYDKAPVVGFSASERN